MRDASAPVKAPFSWPNSSDSTRDSGSAAQCTATNGLAPADAREVDRARHELLAGAPVSPRSSRALAWEPPCPRAGRRAAWSPSAPPSRTVRRPPPASREGPRGLGRARVPGRGRRRGVPSRPASPGTPRRRAASPPPRPARCRSRRPPPPGSPGSAAAARAGRRVRSRRGASGSSRTAAGGPLSPKARSPSPTEAAPRARYPRAASMSRQMRLRSLSSSMTSTSGRSASTMVSGRDAIIGSMERQGRRMVFALLALAAAPLGCDFQPDPEPGPTAVAAPTVASVRIEYRQPNGCANATPQACENLVCLLRQLDAPRTGDLPHGGPRVARLDRDRFGRPRQLAARGGAAPRPRVRPPPRGHVHGG